MGEHAPKFSSGEVHENMSDLRRRPTLGRRNNPRTGSLRAPDSKLKDLLDVNDASTEALQTLNKQSVGLNFSRFVVRTNHYEYPRIGKVPATYYHSKIVAMSVREKNGKLILDVHYDLEDSYGRVYHIVQSYPADSQPYRRLADALAAAGVPEGATADAGVGTEEIVELDYVNKDSDLGSIVNRRPYTVPTSDDEDEDADQDEDDMLLEDDDN